MSTTPAIRAVTAETFNEQVVQRSLEIPVLVDFWAEWCEPCKMLDPILERLAAEFAGRVEIARVDVDAQPQLAQQLQVRGLPTVYMVAQGRVADGFTGVRPEEEIRALLERHAAPGDDNGAAPEEEEDLESRLARLEDAYAQSPEDPEAVLPLTEALAERGEIERSESLLERLPANAQADERAERARAYLHFHRAAAAAPERAELERHLGEVPDDLQARHQLAARCVLAADAEAAAEQLLEIMRRDRTYQEDLGRRALLELFAVLGAGSEITQRYRRRMTSLLM